MKVTEIKLHKNENGKVKANAVITLDGELVVTGFTVTEKDGTVYVNFPRRYDETAKKFKSKVWATSKTLEESIKNAILEEYKK